MPTTQDEAGAILRISQEYFPLEDLRKLFTRLDEEVGSKTDNMSLKQSLAMMRLLVSSVEPKAQPAVAIWEPFALALLVVAHWLLVVGVVASFFVLPFAAPWYIATPLMTLIYTFVTGRQACKLTDLENYFRRRLSLKPIGGFVGHYFMRPAKKVYRWFREPVRL